MALKLADPSVTINGGWRAIGDCGLYEQPDSPMFHRGTFNDLVVAIMEYRIANMLPVEDVRREVEEWICRNTRAKCRVIAPEVTAKRVITVSDVWRWLKTMAAWTKNLQMVSQEEADTRAERCAGCRLQADATGCWGCSQLSEKIFAIIGFKTTRFDSQLRSCGVCGCDNKAQAWVPLDVLKKASGDLEYPADTGQSKDGQPIPCWKR